MNKPFVLLHALLVVVLSHITSPELNRDWRSELYPPAPLYFPIHHKTLKAPRAATAGFNVTIDPELIRFGVMRVGERKVMKAKLVNFSAEPVDVKEVRLREARGFKLLSPVGRFILGPTGNAGATLDVEIEFTATEAGIVADALGIDEGKGPGFVAQVEATVSK